MTSHRSAGKGSTFEIPAVIKTKDKLEDELKDPTQGHLAGYCQNLNWRLNNQKVLRRVFLTSYKERFFSGCLYVDTISRLILRDNSVSVLAILVVNSSMVE